MILLKATCSAGNSLTQASASSPNQPNNDRGNIGGHSIGHPPLPANRNPTQPQALVDNAGPRPKTLLALMKRHQPDQQADARLGANSTGTGWFTLAQFSKHRGGHSSADLTQNCHQGLLTENPSKIMLSGQDGLIING